MAAHVFDFSLLSGAAGRKCLTGECMKCEKLLAEHGVYPKCEKLFCAFNKMILIKSCFTVSSPQVQILHIRSG